MARDDAALIRAQTVVVRTPLVPEIALRLITDACPLWRATEAEAAALGLPLPYWGFCWPGGQVLARRLLDDPELVRGKRVLDFGSGCAVEAIAAMRAGACSAIAADIDPFAEAAAALNAELNGVSLSVHTGDLIDQRGPWDVILAGDVFYERELTARIMSWLAEEAARGVDVLLGDPNRGWLDVADLTRVVSHLAAADGDLSGQVLKEAVVWRVPRVL